MNRTLKCLTAAGALAVVTLFSAQDVFAGWGSWGSYGGSAGWGSYGGGSYGGGSYGGGSYGGWGSHGGPIRRWLHHHHHHGWHHRANYSHGGGGSWGSYGGGYAGYGSSGGWGSSGGGWGSSGGSTGGTYYYGPDKDTAPLDTAPLDTAPLDTAPLDETPPEAPEDGTLPDPDLDDAASGSAMLNVTVPEVAKVYVNGRRTSSIGAQRQYVSRGLANGFSYTYELRAEAVIDGQKVQDTKVIRLRAGDSIDVAFDLQPQPETSLTLHVPEDAKVSLAGNETAAMGAVRVFRTSSLKDGQEWSNYIVRVTVERDGATLSKEETISLKAGESRELNFDFEEAKVASTR